MNFLTSFWNFTKIFNYSFGSDNSNDSAFCRLMMGRITVPDSSKLQVCELVGSVIQPDLLNIKMYSFIYVYPLTAEQMALTASINAQTIRMQN